VDGIQRFDGMEPDVDEFRIWIKRRHRNSLAGKEKEKLRRQGGRR